MPEITATPDTSMPSDLETISLAQVMQQLWSLQSRPRLIFGNSQATCFQTAPSRFSA